MREKKPGPGNIIELAVQRYYESIYKYCCYHLNYNHELAKDCTQDVFLALLNSVNKLKDYEFLGAWLYRTADNYIYRYRSKANIIGKHEVVIDEAKLKEASDIEKMLDDQVNAEKYVAQVLDGLSKSEMKLYTMYYKEKLEILALSERLGLTYGATVTRLYRLKRKIKLLASEVMKDL